MTLKKTDHLPKEYTCHSCKETKDILDFYAAPRSSRGHHTQCKACIKEYNAVNADKNVARTQKWYKEHLEWVKEQSLEYREERREKFNQRSKDYYYKHHDRCLATRRKYYSEHKEESKIASLAYYHEHSESINQRAIDKYHDRMENEEGYAEYRKNQQREYFEANKEKIRENARKAYAKKMKDPEYQELRREQSRKQYAAKKLRGAT